jgi:glycosyltransferase involved in cell wall biosynthesis
VSQSLRFLQVTTFYPPYSFGGDGMYVYRLAHELAGRGHTVDVVHSIDAFRVLAAGEPTWQPDAHPNVNVHGLRSRVPLLGPLAAQQTGRPFFARTALSPIFDQPVDVIHFHNVSLFGPDVLRLGGRSRPAVKLYTTHEHWLVCPTHLLWKYNRRLCERPTCFRCELVARRPPQLWRHTRLLDSAAAHVDRFLSPSAFTARMHAERGFSRPVVRLPPFTPRRDDDWQQPGASPHPRPYFLYVGRLETIKGVETLLHVWRDRSDVDLVLVGDGSRRALAADAAARNPHIVVKGAVAPGDVGRYYVHALGCLVPSVAYEVAPTVVLEAFARKIPVIARDLGGAAELVREGAGLLFRTDEELPQAIDRLAADPQLRQELGEQGYAAFLERWTADVHLSAYLALIEEARSARHG